MTIPALSAYLLAAMLAWAPPDRRGVTYPDARETVEEARERYAEIAEAVAVVALDPDEDVIVGGRGARERTALLTLSVAFFESGFRRDVDLNLGRYARGDSGRSWSLWQLRLDRRGVDTTIEGWTGPELIADRTKAVRAGLHALRRAVRTCKGSLADRIAIYRYGRCTEADENARNRVGLAERWAAMHPVR